MIMVVITLMILEMGCFKKAKFGDLASNRE